MEEYPLRGKKILMFVDDIYEDLELWYPKLRLTEAGAVVTVAGLKAGAVYAGKHSYPCKSDISLDAVDPAGYDALVIPGGFMPDKLRRYPIVLEITRTLFTSGKLVAHICHAGWIPISAKIVKGYTCTSTPGIRDDLENAGAHWVDAAAVTDRNMVSSRRPDDLPDFCRAVINWFIEEGKR